MSQASSENKWKYIAIAFIVLSLIFAGSTVIATYQYQTVNNQNADLSTKNSDLKTTVASDASQIASLNSQISQLQGQVTDLNSKLSVDQAQIDKLTAQIASLQTQLAALPKVDWTTGTLTISSMTCGIGFFAPSCNPIAIEFTAPSGNLYSSVVKGGSYSLWLLNNTVYSSITVVYTSTDFFGISTSIKTCTPSPAIFTPTTNPTTQSFSC